MSTAIEELIRKYSITLTDDEEHIKLYAGKNKSVEEVKAHKDEIISYLKEKKDLERRRREAVDSIEGIKEIENFIRQREIYHEKIRSAFESEDGIISYPEKPAQTLEELRTKYPKAAAYLLARDYSYFSNYIKAGYGKTAINRIADGEDYNTVIQEMKDSWTEYCKDNIWNI